MAYRNLMITTPCRIRIKQEQLVVEGEVSASFPLEDLLSVLDREPAMHPDHRRRWLPWPGPESRCLPATQSIFPAPSPSSFARHSRQLEITRSQLDWTQPARNRWWQQIVQAKIRNQAECLSLCGRCKESARCCAAAPRACVPATGRTGRPPRLPCIFLALFRRGFYPQ